jgi:ankyrin repeat protein
MHGMRYAQIYLFVYYVCSEWFHIRTLQTQKTPLMWASRQGYADATRILLQANRRKQAHPLHSTQSTATSSSSITDANTQANAASSHTNIQLNSSSSSCSSSIQSMLVDVNAVDENGDTALLQACSYGRLQQLQLGIGSATSATPIIQTAHSSPGPSTDGSLEELLEMDTMAMQEVSYEHNLLKLI